MKFSLRWGVAPPRPFQLRACTESCDAIYLKNFNISFKGRKYLVVTDGGVVGEYPDLEMAKQKLLGINSGNRIIAEVNSLGELNTIPEKIANILTELNIAVIEQELHKLLSISEEYLQRLKSRF